MRPTEDGRGCEGGSEGDLQDFYDFRRFQKHYRAHPPRKSAAPALVPLLWRAGFLFLLALGALTVYAAFRPDPGLQWLTAWIGLGVGLLGPLVLRIACELAMTVLDFRDYLRLRDGEWT